MTDTTTPQLRLELVRGIGLDDSFYNDPLVACDEEDSFDDGCGSSRLCVYKLADMLGIPVEDMPDEIVLWVHRDKQVGWRHAEVSSSYNVRIMNQDYQVFTKLYEAVEVAFGKPLTSGQIVHWQITDMDGAPLKPQEATA